MHRLQNRPKQMEPSLGLSKSMWGCCDIHTFGQFRATDVPNPQFACFGILGVNRIKCGCRATGLIAEPLCQPTFIHRKQFICKIKRTFEYAILILF